MPKFSHPADDFGRAAHTFSRDRLRQAITISSSLWLTIQFARGLTSQDYGECGQVCPL